MINESNIEENYNEYAYNNYYEEETDYDEYYKALAEKSDAGYEDRIFDEINEGED